MPRIPELLLASVDSEDTGIDLYHGARPFFFTSCDEENNQVWLEWDVDPFTREPIVPPEDLEFIRDYLKRYRLVLQNPGYDARALCQLDPLLVWDWGRTYDTLLAGHLLSSNTPHDLTTMCLTYLGVRIQKYEDDLEKAIKAALAIVKAKFPTWRRARKGLSDMPSVKEKVWKVDAWVLRALVKQVIMGLEFSLLPPDARQPTVVKISGGCDVPIDRTTKWGNSFVIGRDGDRETVVRKYAERVWNSELINDLPELYGKRIGCHCAPDLCHGDVLKALCHPWMTVLRDYGNCDSSVTLPLFKKQRQLLQQKGLWEIYLERLKVLPLLVDMEDYGITANEPRLNELRITFRAEAEKAGRICENIAKGYDYELNLPKAGNNKSLTTFVFDVMKLPVVRMTQKGKGDKASLDKNTLEHYQATLPEASRELLFVNNLRAKRKRDTACNYMDSYEKFWLPWVPAFPGAVDPITGAGWYVLHPSLNPTGTDTLRWSSVNPNEQNISKQEGFNVRYCFGPAPGREWWSCDAQNIELRIPAYEAGETEMINIFERPNDPPYFGSYHMLVFDTLHPDKFALHGKKCKEVYESTWYQWTKNGNFAVGYGSVESSGTADRAYHVPGAFGRIKGRFGKIHGKGGLNDQMIGHAEKYGYVETMVDKTVGGDRGYPLMCTRTEKGRILPTVPLNYHVQGTAMWWMQKAMVRSYNFLRQMNSCSASMEAHLVEIAKKMANRGGYRLIMQVHDELVFDFPKGIDGHKTNLPVIQECMRLMTLGGDDIGVPTPVSCKYHPDNWSVGVSL